MNKRKMLRYLMREKISPKGILLFKVKKDPLEEFKHTPASKQSMSEPMTPYGYSGYGAKGDEKIVRPEGEAK